MRKRGEVTAQNEEARKLLEKLTLKTYHNTAYGYYVDYRPSWTVDDRDKAKVMIYEGSTTSVSAFVFVMVIDEVQLAACGGLEGFMQASLEQWWTSSFQFELTEVTGTKISYTHIPKQGGAIYEATHHFVGHWGMLYELGASAIKRYEPWSDLYDPYESLRFDETPPDTA